MLNHPLRPDMQWDKACASEPSVGFTGQYADLPNALNPALTMVASKVCGIHLNRMRMRCTNLHRNFLDVAARRTNQHRVFVRSNLDIRL